MSKDDRQDLILQGNAFNSLGILFLETKNRDQAKKNLDRALNIYSRLGDEEGKDRILKLLDNLRGLPE